MEDLLIYKTIADINDTIRFSALWKVSKSVYVMPSLVVMQNDEEVFYADNEEWIIDELYPALQRFEERTMRPEDKEVMQEFADSLGNIYNQLEGIKATVKILKYAIEEKMLHKEQLTKAQ